jgi:phage terminase large subunit-like protein
MTNLLLPEEAPWKPKYHTKPLGNKSFGPDVEDFAAIFLEAIDGFRAGESIKLSAWQRWLINNLCELDPETGYMRYRTALIMIPRKNGKTFLAALLVLFHLVTGPDEAQIFSAAKDRTQAKYVWKMVTSWIHNSPYLQKLLKIKISDNTIVNTKTGAVYTPLAADGGRINGANPFIIIADELHVWEANNGGARAREFWQALTSGSGARAESQVIVITTAGADVYDSLLGGLYRQGIDIANGKTSNDAFGFFCWEADEKDNPLLPETWYKANPNLAEGLLSLSFMKSQLDTYAATDISAFLRYHLNIWTRLAGDNFINQYYWDQAASKDPEEELIPGSNITAGFDGSQNNDSTTIVIKERGGKIVKLWEAWEKDENDPNWFVRHEQIRESFIRLHETYNVELIWADPAYFTNSLVEWGVEEGWNITAIPQSRARMVPMGQHLHSGVTEGKITHLNEEVLTRHVMNAVMGQDGGFYKQEKNSVHRIDALVALVLADGADHFLSQVDDTPQEFIIMK